MARWHEDVWSAVPEGAIPEDFTARRELLLSEVHEGQRVLDLGCGDGAFSAALKSAGAEVTGADPAGEALRRARSRVPEAHFVKLDDDAPLPFADGQFDVVWCGETIEHVVDVGELLSEARRVLADGGLLLLTTPNQPRLKVAAEAIFGRPLEDRLDPRADHLRFFTSRTLELMLIDAGFRQVWVSGFGGLPIARRSLVARAR
ncbi:MAG: methyltransferase domain-containing protein [Actinobacteria bacterium]|uniref:Unannotated protein n=1 Tax=freshwater metagenome TaxID=449393 RepID=A0A6J5Z5K3_9ZZZZ|nr:methyltransferase domain-containing protein [Actinomycetota bacterium]